MADRGKDFNYLSQRIGVCAIIGINGSTVLKNKRYIL